MKIVQTEKENIIQTEKENIIQTEKENIIQTENLVKKYGAATALNGVDLRIVRGELFGLLGVNGAGKTTLVRILSGLVKPTSGKAFVAGKSVETDMAEIKRLIALSPQETSVAPNLTVRENLLFFAQIYGLPRRRAESRVDEIMQQFSLNEVSQKRAKTLSGGWQRRLSVAIALVSDPQVLFLDEPTLGLDVLARRELWRVIQSLKGKVTILLTSHYLEEIEALCDRVAVLAKGDLLALGTVSEIKAVAGESRFEDAFVKIIEGAQAAPARG